jgi:phenylalanine-4-hydroxylase
VHLFFESGIIVNGVVSDITVKNGKVIIITFTKCTVKDENGKIYFEPAWGNYDMAVGEKIVSVYCGAADKDSYEEIPLMSDTHTHHHNYTDEEKLYQQLFKTVRDCREQHGKYEKLPQVWSELKKSFSDDWLCSLEILEILEHENIYPDAAKEITDYLDKKANTEPEYKKLITDGFYLIKHPVTELATPQV